jgi:hypothetical protein
MNWLLGHQKLVLPVSIHTNVILRLRSLASHQEKRRDYVYIGSLGKLANGFLSGSPTTGKTENDRINRIILVDEMGFEPTTSSLRTRKNLR